MLGLPDTVNSAPVLPPHPYHRHRVVAVPEISGKPSFYGDRAKTFMHEAMRGPSASDC